MRRFCSFNGSIGRCAARVMRNGLFALVLVTLFYRNGYFVQNQTSKLGISKSIPKGGFSRVRRSMIESVDDKGTEYCQGLFDHIGYNSSCEFVKAHPQCKLGGFFDYLRFYYCDCDRSSWTFVLFTLWLVVLFYVLGNTAADYFCPSLEKLSNLLKLSPTVAGVALLPLGNGAPDVFASIAAFVGTGAGDVGLNSVLGGAVFVTCIVVGAVSLCVANKDVRIDKKCFIRDVVFFIVAIMALFVILLLGKVTVWAAFALLSIYVLYAVVVAANELLRKEAQRLKLDVFTPLLPVRGSVFSHGNQEQDSMLSSLLELETEDGGSHSNNSLPQWMWATNVAIYSNHAMKIPDGNKNLWGWNDDDDAFEARPIFPCARLCSLIELPLMVPRRLTIPLVDEANWSKTYCTGCAFLSPILLAYLWTTQDNISSQSRTIAFVLGASVGLLLGILAYKNTRADHPPRKYLLLWVIGGFLMSIAWFYIIANELLALLVALGLIIGVNPSILGLTVLAWGNSIGDLVSNVALSLNGGDSVQIAMSACYAGPMFNTLIGLGVSMALGAWSSESGSFILPQDSSLYFTLGFLLLGLVWAVVVLPLNDMRPSKMLGAGLVTLYLLFLSLRVGSALALF